jgi:SHS family lactate transporter-like MFS transporter
VHTANSVVSDATPSDRIASVTAGFLGWTLDAFDYFLVVYSLTLIGREFHRSDAEMAVAITATLVFRPLGAFLFGLLSDRYGRRLPLILNLLFFATAEVATSFAQNYQTFLIVRSLFGIVMGGMWGVGASLTMEKVPSRLRGLLSGLLQQGYALGSLLAALSYFFLVDRLGWRPLFLLGVLPAMFAIFACSRVNESEVWKKTRSANWGELRSSVFSNWKIFLYMALLMTFMSFTSHGTQDMYPTFLQRYWHFSATKRSMMSAIGSTGALFGGMTFGYYSDRKGRKRAMITALLLGVCVIPLWALSPTAPMLVAGAFLIQLMVQGAWGVIPAHLSELSPDSVRGFMPGFAYQCGILISSSIGIIQALFARSFSYASTMAITAGIVFIGGAIVTALGKERHGTVFGGEPVKKPFAPPPGQLFGAQPARGTQGD